MYAIISDGGRQYRVEEGQQLDLDYREVSAGDQVQFERVLAVANDGNLQLGSPLLEGARVTAQVIGVRQGDKITIRKFKRRKGYRRKMGHRQLFTRVQINKIEAP